MIEKISKKYDVSENLVKGLLIIIGLIIMIVFICISGSNSSIKKNSITNDKLNEYLDQIKDNYTLNIDETVNGKLTNIIYSRDSILETYEVNGIAYLYYNNKLFSIDNDTYKLKKESILPFLNNPYYDINLIKNVFKHCELKHINVVKSTCTVSFNDYINEYNTLYNQSVTLEEGKLTFDIIYSSTGISKINVDYSPINRIIKIDNSSIKYGIRINNVGKNNYNEFLEYYKKDLNK